MPSTSVEVFYAFAREDAPLLKNLDHHLIVLQHEKIISSWNTRQIAAGNDWQVELDTHLNSASLILLFISPNFLASGYQYGVELQRAMQRQEDNEVGIIPVLLRSCYWENTPLGKFQAIPRNGKAVTSWRNRDEAFTEIAREIRGVLKHITQEHITQAISQPRSSKLPAIWQIPYKRNPTFIYRQVLVTLAEALAPEHVETHPQPQVISGLGGIGKTQLAIEYAYRFAHRYQAVFWVSAETQESLIAGYAVLAKTLHLPEKDEPDQKVLIQAIKLWLQTHAHWLLILDNVENPIQIEQVLPPFFEGHVLITTRSQITGQFAQRIEMSPLQNPEGALLLLQRVGLLSAQASLQTAPAQEITLAEQISEELGGLPLALGQAGSYIDETACSLLDFHQQYQERQASLLLRRGSSAYIHPESVATTWSLSFEKVEQANPIAAELLRFCAFLSPDAIPEALLLQALKELNLKAEVWQINEAMAVLRSYSLIQRNAQKKSVWVHRLVQAVLRDTLNASEQLRWITHVVLAVNALFPEVNAQTWKKCAVYLPQAQMCARWITERELLLPEGALLLHKAATYLMDHAQYAEAKLLYEHALHIKEQLWGSEHPETEITRDTYAMLLKRL